MSFTCRSPLTRKLIHQVPFCSRLELSKIIENLSIEQREFSHYDRKNTPIAKMELTRLATIMGSKKSTLAELITLEMGKPIKHSMLEVQKAIDACLYYSKNADKLMGTNIVRSDAKWAGYSYQSLGVIYKIVPFNFPLWLPFKTIPSSLITGNAVMLRPPNSCPLLGQALQEIFEMARVPRVKVVFSSEEDTDFIMSQEAVQGLSFTGSTRAAKKVAVIAARHLKQMNIEAGGSDPFVMMEDADIDLAVKVAISSRLANTGQVCIASKRFIIPKHRTREFTSKIEEQSLKLKVGDPIEEDTDLGPLARQDLYDNIAD